LTAVDHTGCVVRVVSCPTSGRPYTQEEPCPPCDIKKGNVQRLT